LHLNLGLVEIPSILISVVILLKMGRRIPLCLTMVAGGIACLLTTILPPGIYIYLFKFYLIHVFIKKFTITIRYGWVDIAIIGDGWKIFRVVVKRYYASLHSWIVPNCYKEFRRGNFKYTSRNCSYYGAIPLEFSKSSEYLF